jgi:SpoU rRNA methylase family enzyme
MQDKLNGNSRKMPIIVCECGQEILVIPDLKEMARCIEAHAKSHSEKEKNPCESEAEFNRIEEQLTQKVLLELAKTTKIP